MQRSLSWYTYILLTKHEGRTGRMSARGLDSTDWAQKRPRANILPGQLRDLLYDWNCLEEKPKW